MHSPSYCEGFVLELRLDESPEKYMIRTIGKDSIYLVNIEDPEDTLRRTKDELDYLKEQGMLVTLATERSFGELHFATLSPPEQQIITRRYKYVSACLADPSFSSSREKVKPIIEKTARDIHDDKPPSGSTVLKWLRDYKNGHGELMALCSKDRFKGCKKTKISPEVFSFIERGRKLYFKQINISIASTVRHIQGLIVKHNLNNPDSMIKQHSYNALKYHITKSSAYENTLRRKGKHKARNDYSYEYDNQRPSSILKKVEIDHTTINVHVRHDRHNTYLGRPYLTVVIDTYSSMVLGYIISFEPPSYITAAIAIKNSILPKTSSPFGALWPAHGRPCEIVADNGAEFWGQNFFRACGELCSSVQYAPVRSPKYKAAVERFFGTAQTELFSTLPGQALPLSNHNSEYNPMKDDSITLKELQYRFEHWLNKIYHRVPHGERFESPHELWLASEQYTPIPEEDERAITLKVLPSIPKRVLDHEGIRLHELIYKSHLTTDLYRRDGKHDVQVKYDPFDLGNIYIYDELNKTYYSIRCKNYKYANGLTLHAHNLIKAQLKSASMFRMESDTILQEARAEFSEMTEEAHESNKHRKLPKSTKKLARATAEGVDKPSRSLESASSNSVEPETLDPTSVEMIDPGDSVEVATSLEYNLDSIETWDVD